MKINIKNIIKKIFTVSCTWSGDIALESVRPRYYISLMDVAQFDNYKFILYLYSKLLMILFSK